MSTFMSEETDAPTKANQEPLLSVIDLKTHFFTKAGVVKAVDGVSFDIEPGKILGLVGESGSGKSVTGFSLIGLVDEPGRVVSGEIRYRGEDLTTVSAERQRALRGNRIAMIFQDPMMTLNPVLRIDTQMIEAVQAHFDVPRGEAEDRALAALEQVGIPAARERLRSYPHQLSGGMRQRVAIAIAFLNKPDLIIADEPTTALDVTIQAQILHEAQTLCRDTGTAMIWITHDLAVVAGLADEICVMYAGRIVERGDVDAVIDRSAHPYTHGLIGSVPGQAALGGRLAQIPGMTPSLLNLPDGCAFAPRCFKARADCRATSPQLAAVSREHTVRCLHPLSASTSSTDGEPM